MGTEHETFFCGEMQSFVNLALNVGWERAREHEYQPDAQASGRRAGIRFTRLRVGLVFLRYHAVRSIHVRRLFSHVTAIKPIGVSEFEQEFAS